MFVIVIGLALLLIGVCDANVALNKPAFASSIFENSSQWTADHGVDGNSNMDASFNGCLMTHYPSDKNPWWMVDLLDLHLVRSIRITDRHDNMRGHFRNFNIDVYEVNPILCPKAIAKRCTQFQGIFPNVQNLTCTQDVSGRYIKLYLYDPRPFYVLIFCEFEVEAILIIQNPSFKSYSRMLGSRFTGSSSVLLATPSVCAEACAGYPSCVGFNYRRSLKSCDMLLATAEWTDLDDSNSDYYTYYLC